MTSYFNLSSLSSQLELEQAPKTCFTDKIEGPLAQSGYIVVAENGKYFNSFNDQDMDFLGKSDIAVRGIWPDKVLAMKMLFERNTSRPVGDSTKMSLIDIPFIKKEVHNVLRHMTLGEPLKNPIPFTTKNGSKVVLPYVLSKDYQLDRGGMSAFMKSVFGVREFSVGNLVQASLKQIQEVGTDYGELFTRQAYLTTNYVTVRRPGYDTGTGESGKHYTYGTDDDRYFQAKKQNTLAYEMIRTITDQKFLDSVDKNLLSKVAKNRLNPEAPKSMSIEEVTFFNLPTNVQKMLINFSKQGIPLALPTFVQQLGEEEGTLIYKVFKLGEQKMNEIVSAKEKITNEPHSEEPTTEELNLYALSTKSLNLYMKGPSKYSQLVDYYKKQITEFPRHQRRLD